MFKNSTLRSYWSGVGLHCLTKRLLSLECGVYRDRLCIWISRCTAITRCLSTQQNAPLTLILPRLGKISIGHEYFSTPVFVLLWLTCGSPEIHLFCLQSPSSHHSQLKTFSDMIWLTCLEALCEHRARRDGGTSKKKQQGLGSLSYSMKPAVLYSHVCRTV